jgi:bifunctional UDP-N-acetylglucosamine pyrophosphorylase/glucosamine-1-phosphate N-acetyltransferase
LSQIELAIVLAAGDGKRMKSKLPKVLHSVAGRPIIGHVLSALASCQIGELRVVIGAGSDQVSAELANIAPAATTVLQEVRGGTGHAVRLALANAIEVGSVIVCAGDTPLLRGETLSALVAKHLSSGAAATVLTTENPEPTGYGRIIRDMAGQFESIIEERDASADQREILEINSGVYVFDIAQLRSSLTKIKSGNAQQEEYLTDVIAILRESGAMVATESVADFTEVLGVNDRSQLSVANFMLQSRINEALMLSGVTIADPMTTWIDITCQIDVDVRIEPGSAIKGQTKVASGAVIGPRTTLIDCVVESNSVVLESHCVSSQIGQGVNIGPYAHLRNGTVLADEVKVGSFVEIKNSTVGEGSKVPHLSYVGDATIGRESNIGAGTVVVNYDGVDKHETKIGDQVRIGSDSMLVAPVSIGDGAYTAAGSVITEDVPPGALGVGRARQVNILGWVLKKRKGTKSAQAAAKEGKK